MSTSLPLADKVALVTGGSRGLGRAMVERFARDGAIVVFSYRADAEAAQATVAAVRAAGGQAHAVQADGASLDGIRTLFAGVDAHLASVGRPPGLDILVANAGIMSHGTIDDETEAGFDRIFDLNVKGVFFTVQQGLTRLRDHGRIVLLGTGLTRVVMPQHVTYSAAKGAVDTLTKVLAQQLGPRGITVNTLAPGAIDTDMNPWLQSEEGQQAMASMQAMKRVGHAADIADVAAFLVSDDARWVTAQRVEASGGLRL